MLVRAPQSERHHSQCLSIHTLRRHMTAEQAACMQAGACVSVALCKHVVGRCCAHAMLATARKMFNRGKRLAHKQYP